MTGDRQDTILVVDDNVVGRYAVSKVLRNAGYGVLEASSGEEALERVAERPALILLDVKLPGISGFEVCRRLKADNATAHLPVLHLSGHFAGTESQVEGLEGGADGYLIKPVEPAVLLATVKAHLRIRHAEEQRAFLSNLLHDVSDAIISTDPEFRVSAWNLGAERVYGWTEAEALGKHIAELVANDSSRQLVETVLGKLRADGRWQGEVVQAHKDGTPIVVFSSMTVVQNEYGDPPWIVAVNRDITQFKRAQEGLRRAEIERVLEQHTLDERRRLGRDLHDGLRQQLIGIKMLSTDLYKRLAARSAPEAGAMREFADLIGDANVQVRRLISGLVPVKVDAQSLLPSLQRSAEQLEQWHGVLCSVHCASEAGLRGLDDETADHLFHIAQEAMTNAAKHGKPTEIDVWLGREGESLTLRVQDDGEGLPADHDKRGGMGLTNMRYRAELIGAELKFLEGAERGTTVVCRLETKAVVTPAGSEPSRP